MLQLSARNLKRLTEQWTIWSRVENGWVEAQAAVTRCLPWQVVRIKSLVREAHYLDSSRIALTSIQILAAAPLPDTIP